MGEGRREGSDRGATDRPTGRRLTVPEAARTLGISADAVRSRIKRGTLETEREGGRVFVVLVGADRVRPTNAQAATDQPTGEATDDLREQVRYLREQLRREQDAHAEARRIIAGLVQRIPELEAPREAEARETPETATTETEGTSPRSDSPGPQTATQPPQGGGLRGLRRRILGW